MKKLVTILSSLLFILGLKAQTPVTVKKETTPQIKPPRPPLDSASLKPIKDPGVNKKTAIYKKNAVNDSMKMSGIKEATIKSATIKYSTIKDATIKESTIKEATIKQSMPIKK
jgi:hypothetical protein